MATVRDPSPRVVELSKDWDLISDLMGGTRAMRHAGKSHLPQWPAEDHESYKIRLAVSVLFPAYARTVSVLTSKPFSKEITIEETVPPRIVELLDNVDLENRNLHAFAADVCADALAYGMAGILVDAPPANGARSLADERSAGIRPYFVQIHPQSILGWRITRSGGATLLAQLRLLEVVEEDDGPFGTKSIEQVRVLEPGRWAVWRKVTSMLDEWVVYQEGTTSLDVIPFVPVYGVRQDFMVGVPPMMELAHLNVEHWQSKSDQQNILHVARVPILFANGLQGVPIVVGANAIIQAESENADLKFVEHSGKAIDAGRLSLLDLEDRMRQVGAELLVIKPGNITEAQTIADNEPAMCDLQRITASVEDSLDQAIDLMARWIGETKGGHVSLYRDFGAATLAEASAELLFKMNAGGKLSNITLLNEMQRRGVLSPDIDLDKEVAAAKADAPVAEVTEQVRV
jgi:hypothetical protein